MAKHRRVIAIVNGHPRSGKDTFVDLACREFLDQEWRSHSCSSIDIVRSMLSDIGVPIYQKTPAERDLLAEVKAALEKYDRFISRKVREQMETALSLRDCSGIGFIHVREPDAISFMRSILPDEFEWLTIFVDRPDAERVTSNAADAGVENFSYSHHINNDGGIDDLRRTAASFVDAIIHLEGRQ